jgi:hypothetical protein
MRKIFYRFLLKKLLRKDFVVSLDQVEKYGIYSLMATPRILMVLKSRYTNLLCLLSIAKKEEVEMIQGRLLEMGDLIDSIENAEESLLQINKVVEKKKQAEGVLNSIKNKLFAFKRT